MAKNKSDNGNSITVADALAKASIEPSGLEDAGGMSTSAVARQETALARRQRILPCLTPPNAECLGGKRSCCRG